MIWDAAQGKGNKLNYIVGKAGRDLALTLRFMPNAVRKRLKALATAT